MVTIGPARSRPRCREVAEKENCAAHQDNEKLRPRGREVRRADQEARGEPDGVTADECADHDCEVDRVRTGAGHDAGWPPLERAGLPGHRINRVPTRAGKRQDVGHVCSPEPTPVSVSLRRRLIRHTTAASEQHTVDNSRHGEVRIDALHAQPPDGFGRHRPGRRPDDLGKVDAGHDVLGHADQVHLLHHDLGQVDLLQGLGDESAEVDLLHGDRGQARTSIECGCDHLVDVHPFEHQVDEGVDVQTSYDVSHDPVEVHRVEDGREPALEVHAAQDTVQRARESP